MIEKKHCFTLRNLNIGSQNILLRVMQVGIESALLKTVNECQFQTLLLDFLKRIFTVFIHIILNICLITNNVQRTSTKKVAPYAILIRSH